MEPLLSIIVPAFNIENYISRCLENLINQKYKNIEIIVVNDGSKDKTGKIIDSYVQKDSRIKVIHKKNGGLSDARNAGINIAKGKYISFVDGDDYIANDMIEFLYTNIKKFRAQIATCLYKTTFEIRTREGQCCGLVR